MTTFDRLINVFNDVLSGTANSTKITPQSSLTEDVGIDSIGMLCLAIALEEEFDIEFINEDLKTLKTVQNVIDCIEERKKK